MFGRVDCWSVGNCSVWQQTRIWFRIFKLGSRRTGVLLVMSFRNMSIPRCRGGIRRCWLVGVVLYHGDWVVGIFARFLTDLYHTRCPRPSLVFLKFIIFSRTLLFNRRHGGATCILVAVMTPAVIPGSVRQPAIFVSGISEIMVILFHSSVWSSGTFSSLVYLDSCDTSGLSIWRHWILRRRPFVCFGRISGSRGSALTPICCLSQRGCRRGGFRIEDGDARITTVWCWSGILRVFVFFGTSFQWRPASVKSTDSVWYTYSKKVKCW